MSLPLCLLFHSKRFTTVLTLDCSYQEENLDDPEVCPQSDTRWPYATLGASQKGFRSWRVRSFGLSEEVSRAETEISVVFGASSIHISPEYVVHYISVQTIGNWNIQNPEIAPSTLQSNCSDVSDAVRIERHLNDESHLYGDLTVFSRPDKNSTTLWRLHRCATSFGVSPEAFRIFTFAPRSSKSCAISRFP